MQNFFTIKADVRGSKQNKKYRDLLNIVTEVNDELSSLYQEENATLIKMTIRAGDELFSIYKGLDVALEALQLLLFIAKKYKVPLYIGCGFGSLEDENKDPDLVNGVSIWRATLALDSVKKGNPKYNEKLAGSIALKINFSDDDKINKSYQVLFYILSEKVLKRTDQQNQAVTLIKKYPKKEYPELFDLLTGHVDGSTSKEDKRIKYTKYLQRAEYHIVNDLTDIIKNNIKKEEF